MTSKNYGLDGIAGNVELGKGGPRIKNSSGAVEARNNVDGAYAVVRGDHPVGLNDLVTLQFLKTQSGVAVIGQINGGAPPAAGVEGRVFVCTTTGGGYTVNHLYLDNGVAWVDVGPSEGQSISITDALSGGSVEFLADSAYLWDADGSAWVFIGPSGTARARIVQGRSADLAFGTASPFNIAGTVPANARVLGVTVSVTQAFNGTAPTLIVGDAGDTDRFMPAAEIDLKTVGTYYAKVSHLYSVETQITGTYVADGSAAGAANILVEYYEG